MAFPIPPAHLPGAKPTCETSRRAVVRRLHSRRIIVAVQSNGNCYTHFSVALRSGEAAELRARGHVDSAINYILRDRVRYWVLVLAAETFEAMISCWGDLQEREQQREQRKRT